MFKNLCFSRESIAERVYDLEEDNIKLTFHRQDGEKQ
jgi:hypothetical protein